MRGGGRTSTYYYGPTHKQNRPRGDMQLNVENQLKQGGVGRGLKSVGPSNSSNPSCSEFHLDGPSNFAAPSIVLRPDVSSKSGPNSRPVAHSHKPFSSSVKSKKAIARSFSSLSNSSAAPSPQTNTILLSRHRPSSLTQSYSHEAVQPSSETFEFSATNNVKGDHSDSKDGVGRGKSETQPRKESAQPQNGKVAEIPFTDHRVQHPLDSSSSEDGSGRVLSDTGHREGSVNEDVDEDRMESEEGGGATPTLQ
nr:hypothetical protein CFP56_66658 [Quercus suber]